MALVAHEEDTSERGRCSDELVKVSENLDLVGIQEIYHEEKNRLVEKEDLIHKLVDNCDTDSDTLAKLVGLALDVVKIYENANGDGWKHREYVWRRCVERQIDEWVALVNNLLNSSDVEKREKLMETALFKAAGHQDLKGRALNDMLEHGMLGEFEARGCGKEVEQLVRTTVSLVGTAHGAGGDGNEQARMSM